MKTPHSDYIRTGLVLLLALEVSQKRWKLAFSDGRQRRYREVAAGDLEQLDREVRAARSKFGMADDVRVVCCYEAGRDGFWIHRALVVMGFENLVIDPASIELPGKRRRRKTDRLDVRRLIRALIQYVLCGNTDTFAVCHVPELEVEDERRVSRELERLKQEETAHRARIRSLLALHGLDRGITKRGFLDGLETARHPLTGASLPTNVRGEIQREYERLQLVWEHEKHLRRARREELRQAVEAHGETPPEQLEGRARRLQMVVLLHLLKGIGERGSWTLVDEFLGWRRFRRGKDVGAAAGLVPGRWQSGNEDNELSITKVGNRRIRRMMIQLAWCWLRHQPDSALTHWYEEKFADEGSRRRRVGIVALARKLLIALWRYVEHGEVIEGAAFKDLKAAI